MAVPNIEFTSSVLKSIEIIQPLKLILKLDINRVGTYNFNY